MKLTLVGLGSGPDDLTGKALAALQAAEVIFGARRLLTELPDGCTGNRRALYQPDAILEEVTASDFQRVAVVFSGDTGFYSGATAFLEVCAARGIETEVCPGVSSVQLLAAALGRPWQGWKLVSAHGRACDPVLACSADDATFFLTDTVNSPTALCARLAEAGLGEVRAFVGENLGMENQRIVTGAVRELSTQTFAPLSVLLVEKCPRFAPRTPGLPDENFIRGEVPMTKQEVRAAALAKLAVRPADTLWDVGAGTGSVSVELALAAPLGRVFAVEFVPTACELIQKNQEKFFAYNLTLVEGMAPEALADLPAPDAVFIGGTKGNLPTILDVILQKNPNARICISAIALETLSAAVTALAERGFDAEVTQIAVSRTKPAGKLHPLLANNPVFLVIGRRNDAAISADSSTLR